MTDEQRPDIQLGTGSPRSELASDVAEPNAERTGAGANPAAADEVTPNRSGSGGSGGPAGADVDPAEEGSTGQSMDELLGGEPA